MLSVRGELKSEKKVIVCRRDLKQEVVREMLILCGLRWGVKAVLSVQ